MMDDLSLHILDIAENAVASGASRISVIVDEDERRDRLTIAIRDNGRGMSRRTLRRVFDPFFTTKGKATGLGLPLLAQAAEQCGGKVTIDSRPGEGTRVLVRFGYGHIDRPPLSNMTGTMSTLVLGHREIDFFYRHRHNGRVYRFDGRPWRGRLRSSPAMDPDLIAAIRADLRSGLKSIGRT